MSLFGCDMPAWLLLSPCGLGRSTDTCWDNTVTPLCPLQDEQVECGKQELTTADIQQKIKEYNAQINSNLFMNMVSINDLCYIYAF